jgi:hypothetical protein
MPGKLSPLEYPDRFEVRFVGANGGLRWNFGWVNVSIVCAGEYVGLEEIDNGIWNVYFGPLSWVGCTSGTSDVAASAAGSLANARMWAASRQINSVRIICLLNNRSTS